MSQELLHELREVSSQLVETLSNFNTIDLNNIPEGGGWTAGQIGDHLLKADLLILKLLYGESKPAGREADQFVTQIRDQFLDFNTKMKSLESILPQCTHFDKEGLLLSLEATRSRMQEAGQQFKLDEICLNTDEPALQGLTRIELFTCVVVHTMRHIHQLKRIKIPHHEWRGKPKLTAS